MPFIMEPEAFAKEAVKVIMAGKKYATIPWEMGVLSKILRLIPNWLFDKILASRKQKPRPEQPEHRKRESSRDRHLSLIKQKKQNKIV